MSSRINQSGTNGGDGILIGADGSAVVPTYSFVNYPQTGMYLSSSVALGFAVNGVGQASLNNVGTLDLGNVLATNGSTSNPSYSFSSGSNQNTGMYLIATGELGISVSGTTILSITPLAIHANNGSAANPVYGFGSFSQNTGMYLNADSILGFSVGGTDALHILSSGLYTVNAGYTNPSYSFIDYPQTGMYLNSSVSLGFAVNGSETATFDATGTLTLTTLGGQYRFSPTINPAPGLTGIYIGPTTSGISMFNGTASVFAYADAITSSYDYVSISPKLTVTGTINSGAITSSSTITGTNLVTNNATITSAGAITGASLSTGDGTFKVFVYTGFFLGSSTVIGTIGSQIYAVSGFFGSSAGNINAPIGYDNNVNVYFGGNGTVNTFKIYSQTLSETYYNIIVYYQ